jgi:hypothetical protein
LNGSNYNYRKYKILKLNLIDSCGSLICSKMVDSLHTVGYSTIIDLIQRKNGTLLCATENLASGSKIKVMSKLITEKTQNIKENA